jgi:hypothetical protein
VIVAGLVALVVFLSFLSSVNSHVNVPVVSSVVWTTGADRHARGVSQ